ncbi:PA14 domain-containing protein [Deinococcus multiflagellatus]|uniref:PA14 domain-containing protein n=1 Tax=Deinococcus multiflagellatus TaxID=1656887 RepID=A0ABW1ZGF2_9DEIO|nr:PA14 domain-containing protein [Deinococcus multiflagellatus]MBZ9712079.1 hypothetical protein [Deinococcus multiflagellatus]
MFGMKLPQWRTALLGLLGASSLVACGQNTPSPSPAPSAEVAVEDDLNSQATATIGLTGVYYNNADFTGTTVTKVDATINKSWGTGRPVTGIDPSTYSVRWTGQLTAANSEIYTFFLTSSGSVQLFVNGQILVNDQSEHASRTATATLQLVAGEKYDIRLDYLRDKSSSGAVKLEWQSAKQIRQIVPERNLFNTGLNSDRAIALLNNDVQLKSYKIALDPNMITGQLDGSGYGLFGRELSGRNFISATFDFKTNTVKNIIEYMVGVDQKVIIKNLKSGRQVDLGLYLQYMNELGESTLPQRQLLLRRIAPVFFDDPHVIEVMTSSAQGLGVQSLRGRCEACAGDIEKFITSASEFSARKAYEIYGSVKGMPGMSVLSWMGKIGGQAWNAIGPRSRDADAAAAHAKAVYDCTKKNCPPVAEQVTLTPQPLRLKVKQHGTATLTFSNRASAQIDLDYTVTVSGNGGFLTRLTTSGAGSVAAGQAGSETIDVECLSLTTQGTLTATLQNSVTGVISTASVQVTCEGNTLISDVPGIAIQAPVGQTASGSITFGNIGDQLLTVYATSTDGLTVTPTTTQDVQPQQEGNITVSYPCTAPLKDVPFTVSLVSNASNKPSPYVVPVQVTCILGNPKLQAPDQLTISAPVGQTASGSFEISNVGDPGSVLNYTLTPSGGLSVSPQSGSLQKDEVSTTSLSYLCSTVGTNSLDLWVNTQNTSDAKLIKVSVECKEEAPKPLRFTNPAPLYGGYLLQAPPAAGQIHLTNDNNIAMQVSLNNANYIQAYGGIFKITSPLTFSIAPKGSTSIKFDALCPQLLWGNDGVRQDSLDVTYTINGTSSKMNLPLEVFCIYPGSAMAVHEVVWVSTYTFDGYAYGGHYTPAYDKGLGISGRVPEYITTREHAIAWVKGQLQAGNSVKASEWYNNCPNYPNSVDTLPCALNDWHDYLNFYKSKHNLP